MKKIIIGTLISSLLLGCASPEFNANVAKNQEVSDAIAEKRSTSNRRK